MPYAQKLIAPKGSSIVQKHSFHNYSISTYTDKQMANVLPRLPVFQPPGAVTQGLCQLMTSVMAPTAFMFFFKKTPNIPCNCSYLTKPQAREICKYPPQYTIGAIKKICNRLFSQALAIL